MSRFIYADHAATTAVTDTALKAMLPYFTQEYGNPSSLYRFAQQAKSDLDQARATAVVLLVLVIGINALSALAAKRLTRGKGEA